MPRTVIIVSIELWNTKLYPDIEEKVYKVLQETEMIDEVYIISFHYKSLLKLRSISTNIDLGLLLVALNGFIFAY